MKIYRVGGAVRDELLGLPVKDRDYVVVGATPEEMQRLGFRPVGRDFPVFLHPQTQAEHALARTERKTARGYKGFAVHAAPEVTLEEDLARRDLTINAIAQDDAGAIIDPYGGAADLRAGVLRHVSPAFIEDPVRILRVARFAARFGFAVAPETMALMREMVANGEVDHLVPERVWQELARGLMEARPARMLMVLEECGALERILPEWRAVDEVRATRAMRALTRAADESLALPERFAAMLAGASEAVVQAACERLRVPSDCAEFASLAARFCATLQEADALDAAALVELLSGADAFRRADRFTRLVRFAAVLASLDARSMNVERVRHALSAARSIDAGAIAKAQAGDPRKGILQARIAAVESALSA